jgi:hypothetical protein
MLFQENCNHDVAWVVRTAAYIKRGASLTVGEIIQTRGPNGNVCLLQQYEGLQIARALSHWIRLGKIRTNADGTFTWLGAAAT